MSDPSSSNPTSIAGSHNGAAANDEHDLKPAGRDTTPPHQRQQPQPGDLTTATAVPTAVSSSIKQPTTTFSDLPPELREMIWHHALPGPRVFHALVYASAGLKMQLLGRASLRVPLAHVCFESRQVVKKAGYILAFRDEDEPDDPGVWFHPRRDVIERTLWGPGDFWGLDPIKGGGSGGVSGGSR